MLRRLLLLLASIVVLAADEAVASPELPALRTGDVVLQTSRSWQSQFIQRATHSPWSHVGLVEVTKSGVYVVEAVEPVKRTRLDRWIARGEGGRVRILRHRVATEAQLARVLDEARRFLGRPYDAQFAWDERRIYCSELVAKAFERGHGTLVGRKEELGDLDLAGLDAALANRFGAALPRDRVLVTPASISDDAAFSVLFEGVPAAR